MLVKEIEEARHTLADSVFVEAVLPQVGKSRKDGFAYWTPGTADRLAARLELHGHAYGKPRSVRPEPRFICHRNFPFSRCRYFPHPLSFRITRSQLPQPCVGAATSTASGRDFSDPGKACP